MSSPSLCYLAAYQQYGLDVDLPGVINVQAPPYNMDPGGATDASGAIQAAANNLGNVGGGVVFLGRSTPKIASQVTIPIGVEVVGAGYNATVIDNQCAGDCFVIDSAWAFGIGKLTISSASLRTAGWAVKILGGDPTVQLSSFNMRRGTGYIDVDLNNQANGVYVVDKSITNGNWGASIGGDKNRMCLWRNFNPGGQSLTLNSPRGASQRFHDIFIDGDPTPANGPQGVRILGTGGVVLDSVYTWGTLNGLLVDVDGIAAESVMLIQATNCQFDFSRDDCFRFNPATGIPGQAPIIGTFSNCWFASSQTAACAYGSHGSTANVITFNGCEFHNAATWGVLGDTGCDATTFKANNCRFGPPFTNALGDTHYV